MEYIVVRDIKTNKVLIAKKECFVEMKLKNTFNEYGGNDIDSEYDEESCMGYNFWNGHNWQTVFLSSDFSDYGDVERLDDVNEEKEILEEYATAKFHDTYCGTEEAITKKYKFTDSSRYQSTWWEAEVISKD